MNDMVTVLIKLAIAVPVILVALWISLWLKGVDRKFAALLQARKGPPLSQPFRDIAKLFQKENFLPLHAVPWVFNAAPVLSVVGAFLLLLYVPLGPITDMTRAFMPVLGGYGDLILAIYILAIPGVMMAIGGFASGSPLATVGAQREMVIMASYEFPLAVILLSIAWRITGLDASLPVFTMATLTSVPLWTEVGIFGLLGMIMLALVFILIIPSELSKLPFDAPEAETEIGGGIIAEYSGKNLALFYIADAVKTLGLLALAVAVFVPYNISPVLGLHDMAAYAADLIFWLVKVEVLYFFAVTVIRVGTARLKIDTLSWLYLVPLSGAAIIGAFLLFLDTL